MKARLLPSAPCTRLKIKARFGLDAVRGEEREDRVVSRKREDRRHLALVRATPHQRRVASPAKGERKSVEKDRFAGSGLAGEHAQPVAEFEIELVDQDHVADRQGL